MYIAGQSYFLDMSGVEEEEDDHVVCVTDDSDSEVVDDVAPPMPAISPADSRERIIEEGPEYAEDIYTYLLTVEVTWSSYPLLTSYSAPSGGACSSALAIHSVSLIQ